MKPLLVKPLPVSTSARILPRTADLVFDSLLCMFDSFFRFNSCLRSSIYFLPGSIHVGAIDLFLCVSLYLYVVRFIFVRFDSFVYGSIYVCAGSIQFLCGSIYFCWFDSFFAVLIFCDRFRFICVRFILFILWLEDFVRNGAPYSSLEIHSGPVLCSHWHQNTFRVNMKYVCHKHACYHCTVREHYPGSIIYALYASVNSSCAHLPPG